MRYPIKISPLWRGFFALFGWSRTRSYAEIAGQELRLKFGGADERIPLDEIAHVGRRSWAFYFGLGAKYGPDGGVSYVGSTEGVVKIDFTRPRPMHVWGLFGASRARCAIVSLESADQFIEELRGLIARRAAP
jgi:hypothetical protein